MTRSSSALMAVLLVVGASCTTLDKQLDKPLDATVPDPCAKANAPITLDNLVRNSTHQSYERCLGFIRDIAATELRN